MMSLMTEHRPTMMVTLFLVITFLWMDVTLYYRIQSLPPLRATSNPSSTRTEPAVAEPVSQLFSPFKGLSVKMMMMDQVNNYIHTPLAELFNQVTHFSEVFHFITPNMISVAGLLFAIAAAKCVTHDSLTMHRLAVLFFQIRTWFDALDGVVARAHMGVIHHVSLHNTSGYVVDGVADALGFTALLIGCTIYLKKVLPKQKIYIPLHVTDTLTSLEKNVSGYGAMLMQSGIARHSFFVVLCFGAQLFISAFCWDRYIDAYHRLLEGPRISESQAILQNEVLRSSLMWILMWFWRISNAHALMQMFLFAIFVNKMWDFLTWIQYIGFIELGVLTLFTEIHLHDIEGYINRVT